jgi:hypothetical protein
LTTLSRNTDKLLFDTLSRKTDKLLFDTLSRKKDLHNFLTTFDDTYNIFLKTAKTIVGLKTRQATGLALNSAGDVTRDRRIGSGAHRLETPSRR